MAKGKKTGGRKPGSPNKITAGAKEALEAVFEQRGGVPAFLAWSHRNPDEFYKLWAKLIPKDVELSGKNGGPVEVTVRFRREDRKVTAG